MIRDRQADAVLICQQHGALDGILWIENRAREAGHRAPISEKESSRELFEQVSADCRLEFLDGFYRFPLPPCQVWWLRVDQRPNHHFELVRGLLDLARRAAADLHVVGVSLYRAIDEPIAIIGFLALTPGITPAEYFKAQPPLTPNADPVDRAFAWCPLSVIWSVGRLSAGASPSMSPDRYPRTAFWARAASRFAPPVVATAPDETGHRTSINVMTRSTPVFIVTCGRCGQTWQRTDVSHDQPLECIFCGGQGRLRLGPPPSDPRGESARAEAWLECNEA
jgi:hypothetical protein